MACEGRRGALTRRRVHDSVSDDLPGEASKGTLAAGGGDAAADIADPVPAVLRLTWRRTPCFNLDEDPFHVSRSSLYI